jgi:hypothetical protein
MSFVRRIVDGVLVVCLGGAVVAWLVNPAGAAPPMAVAVALIASFGTLRSAWNASRGTELRAALLWAAVALAVAIVSQGLACSEPLEGGRSWSGHATYVSVMATLAALISVLNARAPGGGAWALLMGLMVLVFLIPWLEGAGLGRAPGGLERLRLDSPWTIFYWLVVLAGVTNYLPTRYGPAAVVLGVGFGVEYLGLTRLSWAPVSRAAVWSVFPWCLAAAAGLAGFASRRPARGAGRLESAWFFFRDHWGVVWGLRVMERFNRSASALGWPARLAWQGLVPEEPGSPLPAEAESTLKSLIRRFVTPERVDEAIENAARPPGAASGV